MDASRLFLYKVTRKLLNFEGDTGAFLRTTIGAMALFGVPPEQYWPYTDDPEKYDEEPPAFCYAFAQNYQALNYFRLDPPGYPKDKLLTRIKDLLSCNIPSMFGFSVYSSIWDASDGKIPFPSARESLEGGHAIVAVGYDDKLTIKNPNPDGPTTKGAFLIRNSWGESWGDRGYGWLPYDYVTRGLADDWWSLLKSEWIDTEPFLSES
jgi:C1A family cysteine protease